MIKKTSNKIIEDLTSKLLPQCKEQQVAQTESWWLLEKVTGKTQEELILEKSITLTPQQYQTLESWATQRVQENKPLQYILGTVPFCGLEIKVEPPVLIPRPETEEWCDWLIQQFEPVKKEKIIILDLGCGSGCIALALANAFSYATVIGVDIHLNAIRLSEKNKNHNEIKNAIFIKSDLYNELDQYKSTIDLIVSNPPYIPQEEFDKLSRQVTDWEDKSALVAHDQGFAIHKKIIEEAKQYLKENSILRKHNLHQLLLEFGKKQEETIQKILTQAEFKTIQLHKDMEDVYRWVTATL